MSETQVGKSASGLPQLRRRWPSDHPWAVVLLVHGAAEHSGRFEHVGCQLAEAGLDVHSFDWVGHGQSGGDRWHIDSWGTYFTDLGERLAAVRRANLPLVLYGHSMGGLISLGYCLAGYPLPDALVLTSPWLVHSANPVLKSIIPFVARIGPGLRVAGGLKGDQLSRDPAVGVAYFADPNVSTKTTAGWASAALQAQGRIRSDLRDLGIPVYVAHGEADTVAPPHGSVEVGNLPGATRRLYPDLRHELHNEPEGAEVVATIIEWLRSVLSQSAS